MSPPRHISCSLLLPTTGLQVNTSSKPSKAYLYYRSPCHHLTIYLILYYYYLLQVNMSSKPSESYSTTSLHVPTLIATSLILYYYQLHVYRSTRRQNPRNHTVTTGHHVPTSNYFLFSANITTNYMSTCQHVVKAFRFLRLPQVSMSPPSHISSTLLLLTTGLQVNTSTKPSKS